MAASIRPTRWIFWTPRRSFPVTASRYFRKACRVSSMACRKSFIRAPSNSRRTFRRRSRLLNRSRNRKKAHRNPHHASDHPSRLPPTSPRPKPSRKPGLTPTTMSLLHLQHLRRKSRNDAASLHRSLTRSLHRRHNPNPLHRQCHSSNRQILSRRRSRAAASSAKTRELFAARGSMSLNCFWNCFGAVLDLMSFKGERIDYALHHRHHRPSQCR